ncbi:hypothetical protein B0H12DRAFT_134801 [Mycena haematopus]|nr:hypothetical protein B0H12DRAFT_134801 [Mycena haematopus]
MSSTAIHTSAPIIRNFQRTVHIPLDNNDTGDTTPPHIISLNVIVSTGAEIHLDLRSEEFPLVRSVAIDIARGDDRHLEQADLSLPQILVSVLEAATNEGSSSNPLQRTHDSSVAAPTSGPTSPAGTAAFVPPRYVDHLALDPSPSTFNPSTSSVSLPLATGNVDHDEPLPSYSRFPPGQSAATAHVQEPLRETPGAGSFVHQQHDTLDSYVTSSQSRWRQDRASRMRHREYLSALMAVSDDDSEDERPELPVGDDSGRRRPRYGSDEDEDEDVEEGRYAKRNRVESWGPIRFLRSLWI